MTEIRTHIAKLSTKNIGEKVKISGHAETIRGQSSITFIIMRDLTGKIQCVIDKSIADFELTRDLSIESVLEIIGIVADSPRQESKIELQIESFRILNMAEALPIPIVDKGNADINSDARMDWRFLIMRRERDATIMRTLSAVHQGYRNAMTKMGFVEIGTPKLMPTPSESRAELFKVDYFGKTAYLAQSPQLYKQMGIAGGLERVFEIGPLFRADPSFTARHATEFLGMDAEMGYIESFEDVMNALEESMSCVLDTVRESCGDKVEKHFGVKVEDLRMKMHIPRITMFQAKKILTERGLASDDLDLNHTEEKAIGDYAHEKFGSDFIYVTEFPWSKRPFYHKKGVSSDDGVSPISVSADLIYNGTEIATTAQREEKYATLVEQLHEKGIGQEELQWYLDFFRYGIPPHGGWGLGSERIAMLLLGVDNIREVQFLYRGVKRLAP